jgi:mutator protein MutT
VSYQRIVVAAAVVEEGRILLARRPKTKAIAPGKWHLPGGHVEHGEEPAAALARELLEELGCRFEIGAPLATFSYVMGSAHTVGIVFSAARDRVGTIVIDTADTEETAFVARGDLERYLSPEDHNFVAAARALSDEGD